MAPKARRRYGNTHIAGNARVHLGDRQVTRNIRIEKAYIQLQNELGFPDIEALRQALQSSATHASDYVNPTQAQSLTADLNRFHWSDQDKARARKQNSVGAPNTVTNSEDGYESSSLKPSASTHVKEGTKASSAQDRGSIVSRHSNMGNGPYHNPQTGLWTPQTREPVVSNLQTWLSRTLPFRSRPDSTVMSRTRHDSPTAVLGIHHCKHEGTLIRPNTQVCATNDMFVLVMGLLSYIAGQNISIQDACELLVGCQERQLLGFLTCALAVGFYKYFMMRRIEALPCTIEKLVLEDAYGRLRHIPLDIAADFDILTTFLGVHYRETAGTAAGTLVKAGQFHLMLGSRRGRVLSRQTWTNVIVKPGYKLVNSVYISKTTPNCFTCSVTMTITISNEFYCPTCDVFHRDCDSMSSDIQASTIHLLSTQPSLGRTPAATATLPTDLPLPARSSFLSIPDSGHVNLNKDDKPTERLLPDIEYDPRGLRNLDLKIMSQHPQNPIILDKIKAMRIPLWDDEGLIKRKSLWRKTRPQTIVPWV